MYYSIIFRAPASCGLELNPDLASCVAMIIHNDSNNSNDNSNNSNTNSNNNSNSNNNTIAPRKSRVNDS